MSDTTVASAGGNDTQTPVENIVACLQTDPVLGDVSANLERQASMVAEAVALGADIVVLPECSTAGYMFESRR